MTALQYLLAYFAVGAALALINMIVEVRRHNHHINKMDCPDNWITKFQTHDSITFGCIYEHDELQYAFEFIMCAALFPVIAMVMIMVMILALPFIAFGWMIKKIARLA